MFVARVLGTPHRVYSFKWTTLNNKNEDCELNSDGEEGSKPL